MKYPRGLRTRIFRILFLFLVAAAVFIRHGGGRVLCEVKKSPEISNEKASASCQERYEGSHSWEQLTLVHIRDIFPSAVSFDKIEMPAISGNVYDEDGNAIGRIICATSYTQKTYGYGGRVPLLIGVDCRQKIRRVSILNNNETESIIAGLKNKGFFDRWNGLTIDEAIGEDVDTVTGATMTSAAVITNVKNSLAQTTDKKKTVPVHVKSGRDIAVVIVLIFALISFARPEKYRKYRWLLAVSSILIIGFLCGSFLSLSLFYKWLMNGVPWLAAPAVAVTALTAIGARLFMNRDFYCGYVCPYGFAQELAGKLSGIFRRQKRKIGSVARIDKVLRYIRWIFFSAIIAALLVAGYNFDLKLDYVEPFTAFLFRFAPPFVLCLAGVFMLVSVFSQRFWCRHLCPTGHLLKMFGSKKN